jgi:diguanylate cyclase (GGDEF)-like protein/PAS domain S-box-containing protein
MADAPSSGHARPSQLGNYFDLFERLADCALLADLDTLKLLDCNLAAERMLGLKSEALQDHNLLDRVSDDSREEFEKSVRIARRRYYPRQFDAFLLTTQGQRLTMEVTACALKLSDGKEVLQILAKDVTRTREIEAQAERYLEELKSANTKLEQLSVTDELTGISNVRHFRSEHKKEHERVERYGGSYSIVFADVDHFKHYNDRNGHPAGDAVLREVGRILREHCRNTDLPARYGGEEFVVLCAGVGWEGATTLAERVRKAIESHAFAFAADQPLGCVSVSVGIASFPEDGKTMAKVIESADQALYQSKHGGRNRTTRFQDLDLSLGAEVDAGKKRAA